MISKLIAKLKGKPELTGLEIDYGEWVCLTCECSIQGLELARTHLKETGHDVFPAKMWDGTHQ